MLLGYFLVKGVLSYSDFQPKILASDIFADKKNKNKEAVTIAYCLLPIPYPHQKTFCCKP